VIAGTRKIIDHVGDIRLRLARPDYLHFNGHRYVSTGLALGATPVARPHAGAVSGTCDIVFPAAGVTIELVIGSAGGGGIGGVNRQYLEQIIREISECLNLLIPVCGREAFQHIIVCLAVINRRLAGETGHIVSFLRNNLLDIEFPIGRGADGTQAVGSNGDVIFAAGVVGVGSACYFYPVIQVNRLSRIKRSVR